MRDGLNMRDQGKIPDMLRILNTAEDHGIEVDQLRRLLIEACRGPFEPQPIRDAVADVACAMKGERILSGESLENEIQAVFPEATQSKGGEPN